MIIFGAGNYGKKAYKMLSEQNACEEEIIFCDNFIKSGEDAILGVKIIGYDELKKMYCLNNNISIVIATLQFREIYEQCTYDEINIKGIYDLDSNSVLDYKEYCRKNRTGYSNAAYIKYTKEKRKRVIKNASKFLEEGEELSSCITEVAIMISNICNYACFHKKCPAAHTAYKQIMSMRQIKMIIAELKEMNFIGTICFHIYNEPMNDPRLFSILKYVKEELPDILTCVYTNGYYLNQTICDEMQDGLVDILIVTGYGAKEYERILNLELKIPFNISYGNLDDRLEQYDSNEVNSEECCYSLLSQVPIYVNGDLALCCLDYRHDSGLGNVFEQGLIKVLDGKKATDFQKRLLRGERNFYPLCGRCTWIR